MSTHMSTHMSYTQAYTHACTHAYVQESEKTMAELNKVRAEYPLPPARPRARAHACTRARMPDWKKKRKRTENVLVWQP